jgi:hypothetical protein
MVSGRIINNVGHQIVQPGCSTTCCDRKRLDDFGNEGQSTNDKQDYDSANQPYLYASAEMRTKFRETLMHT